MIKILLTIWILFFAVIAGATVDSNTFVIDMDNERVGIGTLTPTSKLQVIGSIGLPIATKTSDYTLTKDDYTVLLNASSNTVTGNLPTAVGIEDTIYNIKCIDDTFTCDIDPSGTEEIDGDNANFELIKDEIITIQSDGSNWWII